MKNKRLLYLLIILIILILTSVLNFSTKSYAVTLPELMISSNAYLDKGKMTLDEINKVEVGKTIQLYAIIAHGNDVWVVDEPDSMGWFVDESNLSGVTWSSSDTSVATIDNSGKLTGLKEGKTTITANYPSGAMESEKTATKEFEVIKSSTNNKTLKISSTNNTTSIQVNNKLQLTATIENSENATASKDVTADGTTWTSSNEKIATVDSKGLVTGIAEGTTTITAKYEDEGQAYTATYNIKISGTSASPYNPNSTTPSTKSDSTTAKTILPAAGKSSIIIAIIVILSIAAIVFYNKRKID